ncbi:D-methionine transport system substrate-binding protein [Thermosporothrix hazakensis]|jgi:D-methionine transport system substrate-binding protein|uniref:Lipoprotein n=1 Tax=Thermosporothrix hazakensis TaxID=644383 RepID=A0A326UBP8_THEHA|nr:MetQ/NlpA family ABC transporter substrate-binding protein [Thermosporothrix hazakensis]PZW34462.1 D-methionine transport system substrate-binding protein [Thermosporothrix hazakensis]GCE45988.1 lipoprotein [Thermosporothrix hazakensis]
MRIVKLSFLSYWALPLLILSLLLAACGGSSAQSNGPLKVGASVTPHAEILKYIKDNLAAKEGLDLQIVEFSDYVQPNLALKDGQLDANFFQHVPYMEDFGKKRGIEMTAVTKVFISPLGIYSKKIKSLNEVGNGAVVAIPNDVTNGGRALHLLADNGFITLKDPQKLDVTVRDIATNPKNIQIKELEAAQLPRSLDDTTFSIINMNFALSSGMKPNKDALVLEKAANNPYANVLTVLKGHENDPRVQKLAKLLTTPEVKKFIEEKYQGAVLPVF